MLALEVPASRHSRTGWIQAALRQAARSGCRFPMGAVLVHGNRILAAAPNKRRNSPLVDFRNSTFHAEVAALRRARRTEGATMYVARVDARMRPAMARPCPRCQRALWEAGVQRVFYTDESGQVQGMSIVHGP
ncbi:deaminase [Streptomyces sp. H27-H1]|uniref:deaminase n=1 Tax=Streptomyces sp. H27-H1 TaxID=2996461 RepID=UPI002270BE60|nr:deaminase [Streptomyces sp. H27-H1]MCY0931634.1 deaminase [Streptomyces sp. H27-H1]